MKPWYERTDRDAELKRLERWIETEYDVELLWSFSPRGETMGHPRALCTLWARGHETGMFAGRVWAISDIVVATPKGISEQKAYLRLLTSMMYDLQQGRAFGLGECAHITSAVPPA